jgi:hypothetical protein
VDTLYIDQNNVEEKSRQVPLVDFIYGRAQTVLVWLGNHRPPSCIEDSNISDIAPDSSLEVYDTWIKIMYWLHQLIHEEYWKRVWIIQEIGMARTIDIYFGRRSSNWMEFYKLVDKYNQSCAGYPAIDPNINTIYKLDALRQNKYHGGETYSLSHLLKSFQDSFASVTHDKIYAFLGMANDHFDSRIPVDYTKGPFELYQDVVVFQNMSTVDPISNWRNRVEMIYFSALIRSLLSRTSELTSRVSPESRVRLPSFETPVDYPIHKKDLRWFRRKVRVWQPSKSEMPEMWFVVTPSVGIEVLGLQTGTIQRTGPSYSHFISVSDATKKWDTQILEHFSKDSSDLKMARGKNERLKRLLNSPATDLRLLKLAPINDILTQYTEKYQARFFIGSENMVGMVPEGSIPRDIICQFWNVEAAAVLRPHGNDSYRYIGRAVIVGNAEEWDRPADIDSFNSTKVLALAISLNELTHLSFGTVNLTVPPDTYSISDPAPPSLLSGIAEEINNRIWVIFCLNILLVLAKSRVKGMDAWEWVIFVLQVLLNMLFTVFSLRENWARILPFLLPLLRKGKGIGNWAPTIIILSRWAMWASTFLQEVPWEGVVPLSHLSFSWDGFLPTLRASITGVCIYRGLDDRYCQGMMMIFQDAPAVFKSAIEASVNEHLIMGT